MSDILSRLEQQGSELGAIASRGQDLVENFDTDRLIAKGQTYAYNMGKAQLETMIGAEATTGLLHGVPVVYKTGRALYQRASGMPTTIEEATQRATEAVGQAGQALTDRLAQETRAGAPPEAREFRYNVAEGRIETQGGEPATFGAEREGPARTPLEQRQFENPNARQGPVGQVPDRPEFDENILSRGGANQRANEQFRARQAQAEEEASLVRDLPDIPQESIGARPVPGEFTGQAPATYTRPGTSFQVAPESTEAQQATEAPPAITRYTPTSRTTEGDTPRDPVGRLAEIRERYEAEDIGEPLDFETREVAGSEVRPFQAGERFDARNLPTGETRFVPPAPGEAPTLSQPSTRLDIPQRDPVDQPLYDRLENLRTPLAPTTEPDLGFNMDQLRQVAQEAQQIPGGQFRDDFEARFPEPPSSAQPQPLTQDEQLNQRLRTLQQSERYLDPVVPEESIEDRIQNLRGEGLPKAPEGGGAGGATEAIEGAAGRTLARTAGEEAVADAIPGIGEILGAGIAIFGGVEAAIQGAEASKMKPPPPTQSAPAFGTAFDSAPVIDSSQYHNI